MIPTIKPTYKQHLAWEALKNHSIVFFGGGAGGGKSWWICETRLVNCYFYPGYKSFIAREKTVNSTMVDIEIKSLVFMSCLQSDHLGFSE